MKKYNFVVMEFHGLGGYRVYNDVAPITVSAESQEEARDIANVIVSRRHPDKGRKMYKAVPNYYLPEGVDIFESINDLGKEDKFDEKIREIKGEILRTDKESCTIVFREKGKIIARRYKFYDFPLI